MTKKISKNIRTKIELVMSRFNFETVHDVMMAMDWTWGGDGGLFVPDIDKIKSTALGLLELCYSGGTGYCSTGGFEATYDNKDFELKFVVENSCSYVNGDEDDEEEEQKKIKKNVEKMSGNAIIGLEV